MSDLLSVSLPVSLSVSYFMEGRDPAQLVYRWNQVLDPSLKKGPWTQQEDQVGPFVQHNFYTADDWYQQYQ